MENLLNSKANILIVDDDVLIAESNKFLFKKSGYNTIGIAIDGKQAIELAKEKQPDLILMDINLGNSIDGITAAEEIQKFADIPFIFLTAYSDPATIERAKKIGPFGYLIKPFDNRELIVSIETSLFKHSFDKKIKEQELIFRTVANFAHEWEFWLLPDLQFKYCSPSCLRVTGYSPEEFTANPKLLFDIVHPDDRDSFEKHLQDNYHGKKSEIITDFQFRIVDKQGALKFIDHTCSPIYDDKNNYLGKRGTNVDITKRKRTEEALQQSEEIYRELYEKSPVGYQSLNEEGRFITVNDVWTNILGYQKEEVLGKWFGDFLAPEYVESFRERFPLFKAQGKIHSEFYMLKKNGERVYIVFEGRIGYKPDGEFKQTHCVLSDNTERKEAEEALRQSEERFKQVSESASTWIWEVDVNGLYTYANPIVKELLGYTAEEVIGKKHFYDFFAENDKEQLKESVFRAFEKKDKLKNFININQHKDGRKVILSTSCVPIINKNNGLAGYRGVDVDITDMKQTEDQLKEKNIFIQTVLDNLPIGIALNTIDKGDAFYNNKKFVEIYGWPAEELKDISSFFQKVYPDEKYRNELITRVMTDIQSGDSSRMHWEECIVTHKDGTKHFVNAVNIPLHEQNTMLSTVTDITTMKEAEQALRQSEQKFHSIFEEHSAVKLLIDPDSGNIVDANKAAAEYYGWKLDELKQMNMNQINTLPPEEIKKEMENVRTRKKNRFEFRHRLKDGSIRDVEAYSSKVEINGKTYLHSINHDVTEKVEKENELKHYREHLEELVVTRTEELDKLNVDLLGQLQKEKELEMMLRKSLGKERELNELKTRFISTASHEFRTPLTTVLTSAEMIQRYGKKWNEEKYNEYIDKIKKSVGYLTKLMDDVLTISRSESGKILFSPGMVDLYKLCSEIIEETKFSTNAQHNFEFNFSMRKIKYNLDSNLIKFILTNLLSNAFKYSPEGGKVELTVASMKNWIQISIADEGIGIPGGDIIHLYEPFHRSSNTVEIPGTGLGLSIVKHAVDLHHGKITVKSKLRKGTIFIVEIPKRQK